MIQYFQQQIDYAKQENKPDFKLVYFIQSGDFHTGISLEIKSINPPELDSYDFSNLEFLRTGSSLSGMFIPTFQYKNV